MTDLLPWMAPWSGRILAMVLFVAGVIISIRAFRRKTTGGHPHCPKCFYLLVGLPEGSAITCPECGFVTENEFQRHWTPRNWRWVWVGIVMAIALPVFVVWRRVHRFGWQYYETYGPIYWMFPARLVQSEQIGNYTIEIREDRRSNSFSERNATIYFHGRSVYSLDDARLVIGCEEFQKAVLKPGTDLNGNGLPDVILTAYSGGAHCCTTIYLLELNQETVTTFGILEVEHGFGGFEDLNHDGKYEIILTDWTYAYWNTSFADSPAPTVVMTPGPDGKYQLAPELMRRPAIAEDELARLASEIRLKIPNRQTNQPLWENSDLWRTMLELIYAGHWQRAYQFFDQAWPAGTGVGRDQFLTELREEMGKSPYVSAIEALGHPPLPRPAPSKP